MRELANNVAQLAAIIMILITLAVSTAAVSQWASAEKSVASGEGASRPTLVANDAARR